MRSTKDLKEIVTGVRSRKNKPDFSEEDLLKEGGKSAHGGGWKDKFDSSTDVTNTGESREEDKKKIRKLEADLEDIQRKFNTMRRNYDSMSNHAHGDKAEFAKIKAMKEKYESVIQKLQTELKPLKAETAEQKEQITSLDGQLKEQKSKTEAKQKEIERLLQEIARNKKSADDRLASVQKQNTGMYEQVNKLKQENSRLKHEVGQKQITIDELETKILLMQDADKMISDYKNQIIEKDRTLLALRRQLDDSLKKNQELITQNELVVQESASTKVKYDESLTIIHQLQIQIQQLQKDFDKSNGDLEATKQSLMLEEERSACLLKDLNEAKALIETLKSSSSSSSAQLLDKIKDLENQVQDKEAKLKTSANQYQQLHGECEKHKFEKGVAQKELEESEKREEQLEKEVRELKDANKSLEQQLFESRKEFKAIEAQFAAIKDIEKTFTEQLQKLKDKHAATEKELKDASDKLMKMNQLKKEIYRILEKNSKNTAELDSTLSCLSCLEYLKDPLTLLCGHSICRSCFNEHSDPNSKDSLVFCEECKIETKNKALKEQQVMQLICNKYGLQREALSKMKDMTAPAE